MRLDGLVAGDAPAAWEELGFALDGDVAHLGGVAIRLTGAGEGLRGWSIRGLEGAELDGLPAPAPAADPRADVAHPNGALAVDHVVALTDDLDRTLAAFAAAGARPRRIREIPGRGVRQAFFLLETALLELAGPAGEGRGARLWGLTLVVEDLDALADRLGDRLGRVKDAVQPGRRIATLRNDERCRLPLAFMTPR